MGKTAYCFDPIYLQHDSGWGHPERAERLIAIDTKLQSFDFYEGLVRIKPVRADYSHIERIHSRDYILRVKHEIESGIDYLDSMDTGVCKKSFDVALYAVGGGLAMCDAIMRGDAVHGFCAVRPPGHHAERDYAAGFCIFNNIAIAARYLQYEHGIGRVAIVDWDVHHGNGTQHSFESDDSVLYISLHQYPYYPGSGSSRERGRDAGEGYTLNIPMSPGSGDEDYRDAFDDKIVPALDDFAPGFILISAGFDAHEADPLASIELSTGMYHTCTKMLKDVAARHSHSRIIAFLEGGYNLYAIAESSAAMMRAFTED